MTLRFYLAHPILDRVKVRKWELYMEKTYGLELYNPFYDAKSKFECMAVKQLDSGKTVDYTPELSEKIVELDIKSIINSDGVVALVSGSFSIGTIMELVYAKINRKPVYVIAHDIKRRKHPIKSHPWIQTHATKIFKNFDEFEKWWKETDLGEKE